MYNVLIRPLVESDALLSWKWRNDSEVWQFTGTRPDQYITFQIEKEWIEKVLSDNTSRRFAILADDEYVGNIQLTNIEENKTAEYHIFIGNKNYWGKGIASLATKQIIRYANTVLHLEELYLRVNPDNVAAIKVYERCNFKKINEDITMSLNLFDVKVSKVSVFMMVYNHEKYLEEALNGVLMQKCNFDYEIVVGEDCSTDDSRSILLEYFKKFPGKFKLLLHNINIGAHENQLTVLENCTGQYIAMCEGDDYWTDPLKLQKQVDFLEANSNYVLCCHKVIELNEFNPTCTNIFPHIKEDYSYEIQDYILNNWTATCSMVFVKKYYNTECWFSTLPFGDLGIVLVLMKNSNKKTMVLKDVMGAYRVHQGGSHGNLHQNSMKLILAYKQHLVFARIIREKLLFDSIYSKIFLKKKIQTYTHLYHLYKKEDLFFKYILNKTVLLFLRIQYKLLQ